METELPLRFFEPREEYFVIERDDLPHWVQSGTVCFLTWRTWDSMPADVVAGWLKERDHWLAEHSIDGRRKDWRARLQQLPLADQRAFHNRISTRWESGLDECRGACVLKDPDLGQIVAGSLAHFDGDRYYLTDYVVMPNHVHVLAAFPSAETVLKQVESWKHYTAVQINRALERRGRFWEVDGFDHLVRSAEQFEYYRNYIEENPRRAGLRPGEFIHHRARMG